MDALSEPAGRESDRHGPAARSVRLTVGGMSCAGCAARVESVLRGLPGVEGAAVNLALERAEVRWSGDGDGSGLADAVTAAGYPARLDGGGDAPGRVVLAVDGMSCAGCVSRVESVLNAVDGVASASVNLALGRAEVDVARAGLAPALVQAVQQAGYRAEVTQDEHGEAAGAGPSAGAAGDGREALWLVLISVMV